MKKVKISELPLYNSLKGLFTLGTDKDNRSVKVSLEFIETTTEAAVKKANDAAAAAKTTAENAAETAKQTVETAAAGASGAAGATGASGSERASGAAGADKASGAAGADKASGSAGAGAGKAAGAAKAVREEIIVIIKSETELSPEERAKLQNWLKVRLNSENLRLICQ